MRAWLISLALLCAGAQAHAQPAGEEITIKPELIVCTGICQLWEIHIEQGRAIGWAKQTQFDGEPIASASISREQVEWIAAGADSATRRTPCGADPGVPFDYSLSVASGQTCIILVGDDTGEIKKRYSVINAVMSWRESFARATRRAFAALEYGASDERRPDNFFAIIPVTICGDSCTSIVAWRDDGDDHFQYGHIGTGMVATNDVAWTSSQFGSDAPARQAPIAEIDGLVTRLENLEPFTPCSRPLDGVNMTAVVIVRHGQCSHAQIRARGEAQAASRGVLAQLQAALPWEGRPYW